MPEHGDFKEKILDGVLIVGIVFSLVVFVINSSAVANLLFPNLKIFLVCALALILTKVRISPVDNRQIIHRMSLPFLFLISLTAIYLLAKVTTPQINFGNGTLGPGYGHDGIYYGRIAENFAWFTQREPPPFCYRILPSLLVNLSGLNTFLGFNLLNLLSFIGTSIFMFQILRFYLVPAKLALTGALFLSTLKFGIKFWIYYPVLTDGLGTFLLVAIIYFTLTKRHLLYILTLSLSVYCRENLLAMIPFHLIYNYRTAQKTGQWKFLSMQVIPLAVFFASRALPIVVPSQKFSYFATITLWLRQFILMPDKQVSFIVAHFNSLGILTILPFFFLKEMRRFLRMNYEWQYYALITLILSVIGGGDMDRFILWQAPFLITALLAIRNQEENSNRFLWIPLLGIQMIAMELFLPWFPQEPFYVSRYAAYSIRWLKVDMIVFSFFLVVATWRIFINYLSQIEKTSLPIGKVVS